MIYCVKYLVNYCSAVNKHKALDYICTYSEKWDNIFM